MLVEVIDHQGCVYEGEHRPLSIWIETEDLKTPGTPCYEKLRQLIGRLPTPKVLHTPGSAFGGRVKW